MEKRRMLIESLKLRNFRCFSEYEVNFKDGINVIYGPNGAGKTSILEAIAYLANPRSFRGGRDYHLVKFGTNFFEVSGKILCGGKKHDITVTYKSDESKKEKIAYLDGNKVKRFRDIQEVFIAIPFSFKDYLMIDGYPSQRREFFDEIFSLIDLEYYEILRSYEKLLDERNALLSEENIDREKISKLANEMQPLAEKIVEKREIMINELSKYLDSMFKVEYVSEFKGKNIADYIDEDIEKRITIVGPHTHDDYVFYYNGYIAKYFASEGQKRLLYLSLIIAFKRLIEETKLYEPVFLFDDPGNGLDPHLLEKFISNLSGQVVIAGLSPLLGAYNMNLARE